MHLLGLEGAPCRVFDHPDAFADWNALANCASTVFLIHFITSRSIGLIPQH